MNWNNLTLSEKNGLMKLYLKHGITSLDSIIFHYNNFITGGNLNNPSDKDPVLNDNE